MSNKDRLLCLGNGKMEDGRYIVVSCRGSKEYNKLFKSS